MIITTSENIAGYKVTEHIGTVIGNTIRAKHIGRDIMAGLRTIVGGEIKEYTSMLAEAREQALQRMIEKAEECGADGVLAVRFQTSMVMAGSAELLVYGTAVKLHKNQ